MHCTDSYFRSGNSRSQCNNNISDCFSRWYRTDHLQLRRSLSHYKDWNQKGCSYGRGLLMAGHISMMFFTSQTPVSVMALSQFIRYVGFGMLFFPVSTWAISMVSTKSEDASTIYNTSREIAGSVGSSILVVIMSYLAGGEVAQNSQSVVSFSQTSMILVGLTVIIILIVLLFVRNKKDIVS